MNTVPTVSSEGDFGIGGGASLQVEEMGNGKHKVKDVLPDPIGYEVIHNENNKIESSESDVMMITDSMDADGEELEVEELGRVIAVDEDTRRDHISYTTNDIFTAINEDQRIRKKDNVDAAIICTLTKRIQLLTNKTNIRKNYGYDVGDKTYLFPEEALYFLETHKLEVLIDCIPISIQRARSLLLNPAGDTVGSNFDGTTCGIDEYTVFKFLTKEGYRPRRTSKVVSHLIQLILSAAPDSKSQSEPIMTPELSGQSVLQDIEMQGETCPVSSNVTSNDVQIEAEVTKMLVNPSEESLGTSGVKRKKTNSSSDNSVESTEKRGKFYILDEEMRKDNRDNDNGNDIKLNSTHASDVIFSLTRAATASPEIICDYESPRPQVSCEGQNRLKPQCEVNEEKNMESFSEYVDLPSKQIILDDSSSSSTCRIRVEEQDQRAVEQDDEDEEPMPSTSRGSEPYIVLEVDSDVEFVDEIIFAHPGVEIEELVGGAGIYYESKDTDDELPDIVEPPIMTHGTAGKLSSFTEVRQGNHILVDLVSSDDEEEAMSDKFKIKAFSNRIWSKLVPNSTSPLEFPPAELLPLEIRRKNGNSSHLEPINDRHEEMFHMQIEEQLGESVVGLRIDSEEIDEKYPAARHQRSNGSHVKSWKDWRQKSVQMVHDTYKCSLFGANGGQSYQNCDTEFAKLNLWKNGHGWGHKIGNHNLSGDKNDVEIIDEDDESDSQTPESYYKFDLYSPKQNKSGKNILGTTVKPSHRLYIIREMEILISLSSLMNPTDGIPLLVAVVNGDQNVTFVSLGSKGAPINVFPLNS